MTQVMPTTTAHEWPTQANEDPQQQMRQERAYTNSDGRSRYNEDGWIVRGIRQLRPTVVDKYYT
jgi:hypothetical protein